MLSTSIGIVGHGDGLGSATQSSVTLANGRERRIGRVCESDLRVAKRVELCEWQKK